MEYPSRIEDAVLVTHLGCMDGAACCVLFRNIGGKKENVKFVAAGQVERFIKEDLPNLGGRFIMFADVGLSRPEYVDVLEKRGDVVVIDHHRTSLHMANRPWCRIDAEGNGGSACGSEMLRRYFCEMDEEIAKKLDSPPYKKFVATVDDFDRWLRREPMAEEMSVMMSFVGQEDFIERFMNVEGRWRVGSMGMAVFGHWTEAEEELLTLLRRKRDENIVVALKKTVMRDLSWGEGRSARVGYVVSSEPNTSLMLNTLLTERPDLDVACQINMDKTIVSLRSMNGYDVSEMAKYFGGGGHQASSGHPLPQKLAEVLIEEIHGT